MQQLSPTLSLFVSLARIEAILSRKLDSKLGGLGFSDFLILYTLASSPDGKMRRIDLADAIGLTASGITRLLLPMEKIRLVRREAHDGDARVSYVAIAPGGKTKLSEALERAELFCDDLVDTSEQAQIEAVSAMLGKLSKRIG